MTDWSKAFDEAHPVKGASLAKLKLLVEKVSEPLSKAEIKAINQSQQNPFPKGDPLYKHYKPFDPAAWTIPQGILPASYLSLLAWSNGGEFRKGKRWFQFLGTEEVRGTLLAYHVPQYMPQALPFALNGGGAFYLFDMRSPARRGEYHIVCADAGNLSWDDAARVGATFLAACRGKVDIDDLLAK